MENNDENGVKEDEMNDDEMNFSLPTKKKKKKRVPVLNVILILFNVITPDDK